MKHTQFSDIIRLSDWLFALGCLALAGVCALWLYTSSVQGKTVVFRQDGKIIRTVPLNVDTEITLKGKYQNVFEIKDGAVHVSYTDCPNRQCLHSGSISAAGASIVCVPNEVSAVIEGETSEIDAYTG